MSGDKSSGSEEVKTYPWLKADEKILAEFGKCTVMIADQGFSEDQIRDVGAPKAQMGRVLVTTKRVIFLGYNGATPNEDEPGHLVTKVGKYTSGSSMAYAMGGTTYPEGFQMCYDLQTIRNIISEAGKAGEANGDSWTCPVTLLTRAVWISKIIGKQDLGLYFSQFIPKLMETIRKIEKLKEKFSEKKGFFAKMQTGRLSHMFLPGFGEYVLITRFDDQDQEKLEKFMSLISERSPPIKEYESNMELVKKDYFQQSQAGEAT